MSQTSLSLDREVSQITAYNTIPEVRHGFCDWITTWWRAILSEFLCALSMIMLLKFSQAVPPTKKEEQNWDIDTYILTLGCIVYTNVQSFGRLSGGFGNPAVSFAAFVAGRIDCRLVITFTIVESMGSCLGLWIVKHLIPDDEFDTFECRGLDIHTESELIFGEIYLAMQIALFGCACWRPWRVNETVPPPPKYPNPPPDPLLSIKFGMMVTGITYAAQWMKRRGGGSNPALSFAAALINNCWDSHWVFWMGPVVGCCLGAALYRFILVPIPRGRRNSYIL